MSRLPPGDIQQKLEDFTIGMLYDALPHPPVNFLPASIPLADYQAAQDPEASKRVKTGFGTVFKPNLDPAAGADAGACPGTSSLPTLPEPAKIPTWGSTVVPGIHGLPTPPASRFGNGLSATTTPTVDGLPPPTLTVNMGSLDSGHSSQQQPSPSPPPPLENKKYSTQFRTPTGAGNNPHMPLLGASNMPYARSVPSLRPIPPSSLPDPGLVFDALLRRTPPPLGDPTVKGQGHGQPHPSGISTLMFAFATLIIHTLFRTSTGPDKNLNLTSSYLDLSVLYGCNEQEMDSVRRKDGTGRIWQDTWADSRILAMVPAVGALLVVFSRNHNVSLSRLLFYTSSYHNSRSTLPPNSSK